MMNKNIITSITFPLISLTLACSTPNLQRKDPVIPSLEYSKNLQLQIDEQKRLEQMEYQKRLAIYERQANIEEMRARYHFISDDLKNESDPNSKDLNQIEANIDANGNIEGDEGNQNEFMEIKKQFPRPKYEGPLIYGDTGRSPSLWEESKTGANDLFRDDRAWLPGDLVTIIITEKSDAKGEADTNTKKETTLLGGISSLLGIDSWFADKNKRVNPSSMFSTNSSLEYKGSGDTTRKNTLTAKISAMVMEVLPTGLLRVEGEKIVSVNAEEQIIKISGIVRPKDVNSYNEIDSSKLGNMRVDYYGQGVLQDVQEPGWGTRFLTKLWPF
mgnify:CR=1 FL=1